jgi:tetratricopeptide (TPR) repeat protein
VSQAAVETAPAVVQAIGENWLLRFIEGHPLLTGIAAPLAVAAILGLFAWLGKTLWKRRRERGTGRVSLEAALKAVVAEIESKVQHAKVAVIPIVASSVLSEYLTNELYNRLGAKIRLSISAGDKDRARMAGLVTAAEAAEAGRGQDVDYAIAGEFSEQFYSLYVRVFDAKKSELLASYPTTICPEDKTLRQLLGGKSAAPEKPAAEPADKAALERVDHSKDLYAAGRTDEAIAAFTQALASNRAVIEALFYRGNAYASKGEYDAAIADYNAALAINLDDHEVLNNRGTAYAHKGDYDAAIADYTAALSFKPDKHEALNNRGNAHYSKRDYDKAIADYTAALSSKPDLYEAHNNRGVAYAKTGKYDKAIADFTAALKIKPDYLEALYNRGGAYAGKGEWDKAIADCDVALVIKPDSPEALYNRGNAHYKKGEYEAAIADYTAALKIKPDKHEALYNRGAAYARKGEHDEAIADYTAALAIKPDDAQIKENLAKARAAKAAQDAGRRG